MTFFLHIEDGVPDISPFQVVILIPISSANHPSYFALKESLKGKHQTDGLVIVEVQSDQGVVDLTLTQLLSFPSQFTQPIKTSAKPSTFLHISDLTSTWHPNHFTNPTPQSNKAALKTQCHLPA